jgi:hypothetical protein
MAKSSDKPVTSALDAYAHGPLPSLRVSRSEYTDDFLYGLQHQGEVVSVPESWDHDTSKLAIGIRWVMYPNGDLERVDMASVRPK